MDALEFINEGLSSIFSNKLRSALSILGVMIGISSVVIMLAVGEGSKKQILSSFDNIDNLITIEKKWTWGSQTAQTKAQTLKDILTLQVADSLKEKVFGVENVIYRVPINIGNMTYASKPFYGSISGISVNYFQTKNYKIKDGAYFSSRNFEENNKVVILGDSIVNDYFSNKNPIGEKIFIGGTPFTVQGVLEKANWNIDYYVFIPATTAINRLGGKELENIEVFSDKRMSVNDVKRDLQYYLMKISGASSPQEVKFTVRTNEDVLKQVNEIIGQMQLLLGAIGSIALVVGGIGIMNIMLVSVTERTREIGIRKSIGATKTHILFQFLIEAIILSMLGCLVAIGVCYGLTYLINKFGESSGFSASMTINALFIASLVSIGMGIISGILPAWKAARLKPIDALRWE